METVLKEVITATGRRLWDMSHAEVITVVNLAIGVNGGVWMVEWIESVGWGALCISSNKRMCVFLTHRYDLRVSTEAPNGNWRLMPCRGTKDIFKYLMDIGVLKF